MTIRISPRAKTKLFCLFWVFLGASIPFFGAQRLELVVKAVNDLRGSCAEFECKIINNTTEPVYVKEFLSGRGSHTIIVGNSGSPVLASPGSVITGRPGFVSERSWPMFPNSRQGFYIAVGNGSKFLFATEGVYFMVSLIRNPFKENSVLFSPITRFTLSSKRTVISNSPVSPSELSALVKASFSREVLTCLKKENILLEKGENPFE